MIEAIGIAVLTVAILVYLFLDRRADGRSRSKGDGGVSHNGSWGDDGGGGDCGGD